MTTSVHRSDEDVKSTHAAVAIGCKIEGRVVSQEREYFVARGVDTLTEIVGMLEGLGGVVAHGHPDVVATKAAFALGSEVDNQLVV